MIYARWHARRQRTRAEVTPRLYFDTPSARYGIVIAAGRAAAILYQLRN